MPMSVAVIIGSLRAESLNRKLAHAVMRLEAPDLTFHEVSIANLPLYNQDFEDAPPPPVADFRSAIKLSDAILIISPEYNRSMPGVLKNAIDVGSRPMGFNTWKHKPTGIFGASPGAIGTAAMQQHLRPVLAAVNAPVMAEAEVYLTVKDGFFTDGGDLNDGTKKFLQGWMNDFSAFVKRHQA